MIEKINLKNLGNANIIDEEQITQQITQPKTFYNGEK